MRTIFTFLMMAFAINAFSQIPTVGLKAYYPFNGNANDMSGNHYNGIVNGPTLVMDRFSQPYSAYSFDGINDYIDLSSYVSSLNYAQPASISFWVITKSDVGQSVFSITDGASALYASIIYFGNNITNTLTNELITVFQQATGTDKYISGFETTNRGLLINSGWHHVVVVYDDVLTKIYLDNSLLITNCTWGVNNGHFGNINIALKAYFGARYLNGIGGYLKGELDDVRIYNIALTPVQVTSLYQETVTTIENNENSNLVNIYPNPTVGKLTVNCNVKCNYLEVLNILGETIYSFKPDDFQSQFEIDITDKPKGVYFLKIYNEEKSYMQKFITI